ncbi:hypothetical protein, partial [Klebsiella pneumoniae]
NIRLNQTSHIASITPFNPSISDYIINRIAKDDTNLSLYMLASKTYQSINTLFFLAVNNKLDNKTFNSVLNILISDAMSKDINNYATHLYYKVLTSDISDTEKLKKIPPSTFLNINKSQVSYDSEIGECIIWAIEKQPHLFSKKFAIDFIDYALCSSKQYSLYHEDYLPLAKLMTFYPDIEQDIKFRELKDHIIDFWESGFDEILGDSAKIQNLSPDDFDTADDVALNYLHEFLDEYPFEFHERDIESIMDNIDTSSHLPDYSYYHDDDDGYRPKATQYVNTVSYIDDLFSR